MYARLLLAFVLLDLGTSAAMVQQVQAHYLDTGNHFQARVLANDGTGNLFIVSNTIAISGRPQIRVIKTDPQGNILASLDFGGSSLTDLPAAASTDPQGNLIIVGTANSFDFPVVSPLFSTTLQGGFITKIDAQLQHILLSTRFGGSHGGTSATAVAVDNSGNMYVTGSTSDTDFPVTPGAFQTEPPSNSQFGSSIYAFVMAISAKGDHIIYSTYFEIAASTLGHA